jgi:hypothetical protein
VIAEMSGSVVLPSQTGIGGEPTQPLEILVHGGTVDTRFRGGVGASGAEQRDAAPLESRT